MKKTRIFASILLFSLGLLGITAGFALEKEGEQTRQKVGLQINIAGAIGPATADTIHRVIKKAEEGEAAFVLLRLDTPGGLDKSMRNIVKDILASKVPVVTFVAPSGARAASAGTFILYASHVAAMAPGTNIGAATPVQVGGGGGIPGQGNKDKKQDKSAEQKSTLSKKVTSDAIAYIRSIAEFRGRNVAWAEKAVREAHSISAKEALSLNVIDLMAADVPDLLAKINGRTVKVGNKSIVLDTKGIAIKIWEPDWRAKFLTVLTDPSVAYILLLLGIYGLFFEFANPGFVLPGVVGAIALLLALYAFQLLPISYAGLGLILLGIIFMIGEAFMPSFGALGIGGVIAFVAGSILLFDSDVPGFSVAWPLIFGMAAVTATFFLIVLTMAMKARKRTVVTGWEAMVGREGVVIADFENEGQGRFRGEIWRITSHEPLKAQDEIVVIKVEGLSLTVKKK